MAISKEPMCGIKDIQIFTGKFFQGSVGGRKCKIPATYRETKGDIFIFKAAEAERYKNTPKIKINRYKGQGEKMKSIANKRKIKLRRGANPKETDLYRKGYLEGIAHAEATASVAYTRPKAKITPIADIQPMSPNCHGMQVRYRYDIQTQKDMDRMSLLIRIRISSAGEGCTSINSEIVHTVLNRTMLSLDSVVDTVTQISHRVAYLVDLFTFVPWLVRRLCVLDESALSRTGTFAAISQCRLNTNKSRRTIEREVFHNLGLQEIINSSVANVGNSND